MWDGLFSFSKMKTIKKKKKTRSVLLFLLVITIKQGTGARASMVARKWRQAHALSGVKRLQETESDQKRPMIFIVYISKKRERERETMILMTIKIKNMQWAESTCSCMVAMPKERWVQATWNTPMDGATPTALRRAWGLARCKHGLPSSPSACTGASLPHF